MPLPFDSSRFKLPLTQLPISHDVVHGSMYVLLEGGTAAQVYELANKAPGTKFKVLAHNAAVREVEFAIQGFVEHYSAVALHINNVRTLYRTSSRKIYFDPNCVLDLHEPFVFRTFDGKSGYGEAHSLKEPKKFVKIKSHSYLYCITPGPVMLSPPKSDARPNLAFLPFYIS